MQQTVSAPATDRAAGDGLAITYRAGAWREELDAWPAQNGGVVVRLTEEDDGERCDALTILTPRDATRFMAWLNGWFVALPLRQRAELANGLNPEHVPGGAFLVRVRSAERTVHDYPSLGRPVAVDLADLLAAAE